MAAEPRFRLRQPNAKKEQPITLVLRHKDIKVTIPTGFNIHPDHWNFREQKVRNVVEVKNKDEINTLLSKYYDAGELAISQLKAEGGEVTKEKLKRRFQRIIDDAAKAENHQEDTTDVNSMLSFIDRFIEQAKVRTNPNTGEKLNPATINKYKNTRKRLVEFQRASGREVNFEFIDLDFYYDYVDFLSEHKNYALNTVGRYIKTLKEFLNDATEKGINQKLDFRNRRFKVLTEDVDAVYLSEKELAGIFACDLNDNKKLDKARDLFLIGAWTGLRFSDFSRLTRNHIVNNAFLSISQQKSKGKVVIPINPTLKSIIEKYDWNFPEPISNQNLNDYIKEVCDKAGITDPITTTKTIGGERVSETQPKFKLVATHTARRSFATNLYKSGFPAISIMKITGHKTEKSFLKYIKVTPEEHAELLQKHWEKQLQNIA
jgi:integrase